MARRRRPTSVVTGIGDDSAVLRFEPGQDTLVTTDLSIEGVHFRREWHPPESVGHRCLVRGLSDIAAMGGLPAAAFLSLALPEDLPQSWVNRFLDGLLKLARRYKVQLAGGDIAQSPRQICADIVVIGSVPQDKAILRSGARPGDVVYVTGSLGGSAAVLQNLRKGRRASPRLKTGSPHFYPEPRIATGQWLRTHALASAMIDLSDGLSTDLSHICDESHVRAVIDAELLPVHPAARKQREGLELALHGGEDYELLFTAPSSVSVPNRISGVPVTRIGEIARYDRKKPQVEALIYGSKRPLLSKGWEHFAKGFAWQSEAEKSAHRAPSRN
jgi:thiamine-monophosphate kinase